MNKLEQAARLALEAWDNMNSGYCTTEFNALREALAEQAEQKVAAWIDPDDLEDLIESGEGACVSSCQSEIFSVPLYTAPLRTKDLTDDEIESIMVEQGDLRTITFARAVIAADREKNK